MAFEGSDDSNKEEHKKTDYAIDDDYDAPVYEIPHKQAWSFDISESNGGLNGSEHSNEEEDQTIEFAVETYCDASFNETHHNKSILVCSSWV